MDNPVFTTCLALPSIAEIVKSVISARRHYFFMLHNCVDPVSDKKPYLWILQKIVFYFLYYTLQAKIPSFKKIKIVYLFRNLWIICKFSKLPITRKHHGNCMRAARTIVLHLCLIPISTPIKSFGLLNCFLKNSRLYLFHSKNRITNFLPPSPLPSNNKLVITTLPNSTVTFPATENDAVN